MIALDTNILARFYVDDPGDPQADQQRPIARRILTESPSLFVPSRSRAQPPLDFGAAGARDRAA